LKEHCLKSITYIFETANKFCGNGSKKSSPSLVRIALGKIGSSTSFNSNLQTNLSGSIVNAMVGKRKSSKKKVFFIFAAPQIII
jgi:hypothetical protein